MWYTLNTCTYTVDVCTQYMCTCRWLGGTTSPALCHPKDMLFDGGRLPTHRAKRLIMKPQKSDNMWAASVMMARLLAK